VNFVTDRTTAGSSKAFVRSGFGLVINDNQYWREWKLKPPNQQDVNRIGTSGMARYFFDMAGVDVDDIGLECATLGDARNAAISYLGEYLRDFPEYASQGHWQVDVCDNDRNPIFNVVVATVDVSAMNILT
jgi:hypothetical protein